MVSTNNSDFPTKLSFSLVLMSRKLLPASAGLELVFTTDFDVIRLPLEVGRQYRVSVRSV